MRTVDLCFSQSLSLRVTLTHTSSCQMSNEHPAKQQRAVSVRLGWGIRRPRRSGLLEAGDTILSICPPYPQCPQLPLLGQPPIVL